MATKRNPKWTEDELTLALDLFIEMPSSDISANHRKIIELSEMLNKLRATERLNENYRNANGTALKLHNFARFDVTRTARGMTHGGKLEKVIWDRYAGNRSALKNEASEIRRKVSG